MHHRAKTNASESFQPWFLQVEPGFANRPKILGLDGLSGIGYAGGTLSELLAQL